MSARRPAARPGAGAHGGALAPARARALALALACAAAAAAPPPAAAQGVRPVQVETEVRPDTVRLGDVVTVRYRMWLPDGSKAAFPARPRDDSLFRWTAWRGETVRAGSGVREHRLTASFQTFALGTVALPGVPVQFTVPGEPPRRGRFPTSGIVVLRTVPAGGDEPPLRDLKPPVAPPWWALVPWPWVAAGLLLVALMAWLVWRWRRSRRRAAAPRAAPEVPLDPPHVEAARRLAALVARGLPEAGRTYEHGSELADLLRRFVERRFDGLRPGDTSGEVARRLAARPGVAAPDVASLRDILEACDLTKFARRPYDAPRAHAAEAEAGRLSAAWREAPGDPAAADAPGSAAPGAPAVAAVAATPRRRAAGGDR